jgi:hypothetical protein
MVGYFTDEDGHTWSPKERDESYKKTVSEIEAKRLLHPSVLGCNRCKQTQGIIHFHNHNYSDPVKYLEPLCFRCHQILHAASHSPEQAKRYFKGVTNGDQWPPIFNNNFYLLWQDNGIAHPEMHWKTPTKSASIPINRYLAKYQNYVWPESISKTKNDKKKEE